MITVLENNPLETLGKVVYANRHRARTIWFITPWISGEPSRFDSLSLLIEGLKSRSCTVYIVTRPPVLTWHQRALKVLRENVNPILCYNKHLHTKLYILEADGFRYALIGSPNLTRQAETVNRELAVEIRASTAPRFQETARLIQELIVYAQSIMAENETLLVNPETEA